MILKKNGLKSTPCREAIIDIMSAAHAPLSAEEIHEHYPRANLSTVYRNLDAYTARGIVERIAYGTDNKYRYTLSHTHRHYFRCTRCNSRMAVDGCPLNAFEQQLESSLGVLITEHNLELTGLCRKCRQVGDEI